MIVEADLLPRQVLDHLLPGQRPRRVRLRLLKDVQQIFEQRTTFQPLAELHRPLLDSCVNLIRIRTGRFNVCRPTPQGGLPLRVLQSIFLRPAVYRRRERAG